MASHNLPVITFTIYQLQIISEPLGTTAQNFGLELSKVGQDLTRDSVMTGATEIQETLDRRVETS